MSDIVVNIITASCCLTKTLLAVNFSWEVLRSVSCWYLKRLLFCWRWVFTGWWQRVVLRRTSWSEPRRRWF